MSARRALVGIAAAAALIAVVGCDGDGGSALGANPYDNGFRLVRETTDNLLFDSLDGTVIYDYADPANVVYTRTSFDDGIEATVERRLTVDAAGRLTRVDGDDSRRNLSYDSEGRLVRVENSRGPPGFLRTLVFEHVGSALQGVRVSSGGSTMSFTRDDDARLLSAVERFEFGATSGVGTVTRFTYDAAGRRVSASMTSGGGEVGFAREYEYDADGNLVRRTITRPRFGDVYQVDVYEYEPNTGPMFNHELMVLELQPAHGVIFGFLRPV